MKLISYLFSQYRRTVIIIMKFEIYKFLRKVINWVWAAHKKNLIIITKIETKQIIEKLIKITEILIYKSYNIQVQVIVKNHL